MQREPLHIAPLLPEPDLSHWHRIMGCIGMGLWGPELDRDIVQLCITQTSRVSSIFEQFEVGCHSLQAVTPVIALILEQA